MKYLTVIITTFLALVLSVNTFAFDGKSTFATGESYFDVATGHRYIKNPDTTYREYTKKGELFRVAVPPDLPLLTTNKYLREIGQNCFVMYEKLDRNILKKQILPASSRHPKGWRAKAAFSCPKNRQLTDHFSNAADIQSRQKMQPKQMATAKSYFDVATGHRYVKNADSTYREYTKKGDLFRVSVSPELPLLTTNRHIREIGQDSCLLYQRNINRVTEIMVLPSDQEHPKGWSIERILVSMNQ